MRRRSPALLMASMMLLSSIAQSQKAGKTASGVDQVEKATTAFREGSEALARGDTLKAQKFFEDAVHSAPGVAAAHTALGSVLRVTGQFTAAEAELKTALHLDPSDRIALLNLAIVDSLEGRNQESAAQFARLRKIDPQASGSDSPEAAIPLAAALSRTGDIAQAQALLVHAAAAYPDNAELADALGTIKAAQGLYSDAESDLRRAINLNDQLALAHFHLGEVGLALQQPQQAADEFDRAHALQPADSRFTLELAHALDLLGDEAKRVTVLQAGLSTQPEGDAATEMRYRLALALQSEGRAGDSVALFKAVLAERPHDPEVLINAGLADVQTGDARAGVALYQRALNAGSVTPTLREDLGVAYLQQGDLNDALAQFRQGLTLDPANPQLHYDLGLALKLKDNLAEAIPEFLQAATLDPTMPDPPYTLGVIYMQQGRFADAARMLSQATDLRPANGDGWATLGSVYRELGEPEKAEAALRHAILLLPDQPSPHINLASVLLQEGKKAEAVAERKRGAELTRIAVNRQKASFGVNSGAALLKSGKVAEALQQYEDAVQADPGDAEAHAGLAQALDRSGRKADAAEERKKAADLGKVSAPER